MRATTSSFVLLLIVLLAGGCADQNGGTPERTGEPAPSGSTPATTAGAISGEVLETMDSGGYTYVRLEADGEEVWAAGPVTPMTVGARVSVSTDMPMKGFRSESLDRSFDTLYFVSGFDAGGGSADPHAGMMGGMAKSMGGDSAPAAGHGNVPAPDVEAGAVSPVADGHTVGALYGARSDLAGQTTSVRGKVVKFNGGIMGKNWIHVQDGTGDPGAKTHDLLITTNEKAQVGDTITATGTVTVDKDFGAGYRYQLLLEDAKIEVDRSTTGR